MTIASGALVTAADDGSFTYDPNGQFEWLAVGEAATDSLKAQISALEARIDSLVAELSRQGAEVDTADVEDAEDELAAVLTVAAGGEAFGTLPVVDVQAVRQRVDDRRPDWV